MEIERLETPKIRVNSLACSSGFSNLLSAASAKGCCVSGLLHPRDLQEIKDRFDQWAGNLGALQPFESPLSLDHRLRNDSLVKESVLKSLTDLSNSIQAATEIALGSRPNRVSEPFVTGPDLESEYDLSSESDTSSISSSGEESVLGPTSEIQTLVSAMRSALGSLFKSSIFVRAITGRNRRLREAEMKPSDTRTDINHVTDRYPLLNKNETLIGRLVEANARRRQYFNSCKDDHERLSILATRGRLANVQVQADQGAGEPAEPKTIPTSATERSRLADIDEAVSMADEAVEPGTIESLKAMSVVSSATSIAEFSDTDPSFPLMPIEAKTSSRFLCPFCFRFLQLEHQDLERQWRKHVLQDLEPYICTFSSCSLDTFQSQHTWFDHELLKHRSRWICSECRRNFRFSDDLKEHVSRHHTGLVSTRQLPAFLDQSKRPVDSIDPRECPFCDSSWAQAEPGSASSEETVVVGLDHFRRHLGKHLQQVALFALPRQPIQDELQSLVSQNDAEPLIWGDFAMGYRWIRNDCGRGWSILSRKRGTVIALASFLRLWQAQRAIEDLESLENALKNKHHKQAAEQQLRRVLDFRTQSGLALQKASIKGHIEVAQFLLDKDVDVNTQCGYYGNALLAASLKGEGSIVQLLLDRGADVNVQSGHYGTALQTASLFGNESTVLLLLDRGADVNAQGGLYGSALQAASISGNEKIVRLLLDRGADVDAQGEHHGTALQTASLFGNESTMLLLLDRGADMNMQGGYYGSPLQAATRSGNERVVRLLLDRGADANIRSEFYGSALQTALMLGEETIVQLLLEHGADPNMSHGEFDSALQAAASEDHHKFVRLLIGSGAGPRAQGGCYGTALQAAYARSHLKTMRILLENGADATGLDLTQFALVTVIGRGSKERLLMRLDGTVGDLKMVTVIGRGSKERLLMRLDGTVGDLKKTIIKDIEEIKRQEAADPGLSVSLIFEGKELQDENRLCKEEGIQSDSILFCITIPSRRRGKQPASFKRQAHSPAQKKAVKGSLDLPLDHSVRFDDSGLEES